MSPRLADLHRDLQRLAGPSVRKAQPKSPRELAEEHACEAFNLAAEACSMPQAILADQLKVCRRMVIDYEHGARVVPLWVFFLLPRAAKIALLQFLMSHVGEEESGERCA